MAGQNLQRTTPKNLLSGVFAIAAMQSAEPDSAPVYEQPDHAPLPLSNGADRRSSNRTAPEPRKKTLDEEGLERQSGLRAGTAGYRDNADDEAQEIKDRKDAQMRQSVLQESLFDDDDPAPAVNTLTDMAKNDQSWLDLYSQQRSLTNDDMLRVDASGNRVSAKDDPEGRHIVRTTEQKRAFEARHGACSALHAQDEVTYDAQGRLVTVENFQKSEEIRGRMQSTNAALYDVRSGKTVPSAIDPEVKERMTAHRSKTGPAEPAAPGSNPSIPGPAAAGNDPQADAQAPRQPLPTANRMAMQYDLTYKVKIV